MHDQPIDCSTNDLFPVGRRRKPNFTDNEVLTIINQYEMYKELLHSREASKSVIAQKQAIWKRITETLNTAYPQVERTVEDVRRKWKKLQSEAKRESAAHRQAQSLGTSTSIWNKQINLYDRILSICRPSATSTSHFPRLSTLQQQQQQQGNNHHEIIFNEQSSDKIDSPSSDLANGVNLQTDSPGDESTSLLLDNDDNPSSPITHLPSHQANTSIMNNQVSKRTLDKRRKLLKSSVNQMISNNQSKSYGDQQTSLRYESLIKRKRTLELTSQKLLNDRECLLIERKNLEIKLATNECENERIHIEKRRTELLLQKLQNDISLSTTNGTTHFSDPEDHEDNNSLDDISDLNE